MTSGPREIGGARIICFTAIDQRPRPSEKCTHIVAGILQGPAAGLAIGQHPGEKGYYLFRCNAAWEIVTDTWHPTLEEAKEQAVFEYEGVSSTWQRPADFDVGGEARS